MLVDGVRNNESDSVCLLRDSCGYPDTAAQCVVGSTTLEFRKEKAREKYLETTLLLW